MTTTYLSPFDANLMVTHGPDGIVRVNRFGIGYGQRGFWGNKHFPTQEIADQAFDAMVADLRRIYGMPARNWTGQYREDWTAGVGSQLLRRVRFIPIRKDGKEGKTIHIMHMYKIEITNEKLSQIADALRIDVI